VKNGKGVKMVKLLKVSDTPIRNPRHIKIIGEANPYDPQWAAYFERRAGIPMEQ
jgi:RNA-directed DNA polymerase